MGDSDLEITLELFPFLIFVLTPLQYTCSCTPWLSILPQYTGDFANPLRMDSSAVVHLEALWDSPLLMHSDLVEIANQALSPLLL